MALVRAGASVTVVGRSITTGKEILKTLKELSPSTSSTIDYIQGDIGTVQDTNKLIAEIAKSANEFGNYNYLITTAAVFPDFNNLQNEDHLGKVYAYTVQ